MKGLSIIVKTITRWISPLIFVFGVYLVLYGHLTPGGGFPGGIVLTCLFVLLVISFGKDFALKKLSRGVASKLDSVGALLFLALGLIGIFAGGHFFINFVLNKFGGIKYSVLSAGFIPIANIAVAIKVMAGLFIVFLIISGVRFIEKDKHVEIELGEDE